MSSLFFHLHDSQPSPSLKKPLAFTPKSFLYQSITPVSTSPFDPQGIAVMLHAAALSYWLSRQTQRSPSPIALLQSECIEPLCSDVLRTVRLHKHTHGLHLSPQLREKANVLHLSITSPSSYDFSLACLHKKPLQITKMCH